MAISRALHIHLYRRVDQGTDVEFPDGSVWELVPYACRCGKRKTRQRYVWGI